MDRRQRIPMRTVNVPDAFKVLPPLSPELPAPPSAPKSSRVAPLTVSRRDQSAFVILAEADNRTSSPAPISGRVSPFRGRGFKTPTTSRHPSRDPTPERSRSRLPVARPRGRSSVSISPARNSTTSIPKPILRRNSLSPNRASRALNQVNNNKSFVASKNNRNSNVPVNANDTSSPSKRFIKQQPSTKRVGPVNTKSQNNNLTSKPPVPKQVVRNKDVNSKPTLPATKKPASNSANPNKNSVQNVPNKSPSKIPRSRNSSLERVAQPPRKDAPKTKPQQTPASKKPLKNDNAQSSSSNSQDSEKKAQTDDTKLEKVSEDVQPASIKDNFVSNKEIETPIEKSIVEETPIKLMKANHSTESEPSNGNESSAKSQEAAGSDDLSIKSKVTITSLIEEGVSETSIALVRTTTAPALELAQPDVIPTILSPRIEPQDKVDKNENDDEKESKTNKIVEDPLQTTADGGAATGFSAESVRSTSSVETVRAVTRVKQSLKQQEEDVKGKVKEDADAEVLSANNLIRSDSLNNNSSNRTVAWENMSPGRTSIYPEEPVVTQPSKKRGCCGKFLDRFSCKCCKPSMQSNRKSVDFGKFCSKLNCFKNSSCCKKPKDDKPKPLPRQKKSKLKECLLKLNCCRSMKCCKKTQIHLEDEEAEEQEDPPGCCGGCGKKTRKFLKAMFCLNLACCQKLRTCGGCSRFGCCQTGGCCGPSPPDTDRRKSRFSLKRTDTNKVVGLPKLDPTLVEHTAFIRGAIPVLPVPIAWICLILNVFLPGIGTLFSGMFCLCIGKPRFSINDSHADRLKAFCVNLIISACQIFSIVFCLVGWGWSIWWGVIMIRLAKKHRRIILAEKTAEEPVPVAVNQNHDVERAR
uniref:Protein stum n=1 Tax=Clastoptera arizonana TaxID=38151 RepID=A0A1B6E608_9HEMI